MNLADAARLSAEGRLIRLRRRALYGCLAALLATDIIWCAAVGMAFGGLWRIIGATAALAAVAVLYRRRSAMLSGQAEATAAWVAFTAESGILTYLGATFALPWQDRILDAADRALGFDWPAWRDRAEALPLLHQALVIAYASLLPQILIAVLFFPATGRAARGLELILLATISIIPTTVIATLWPALGPFSLYGGHSSWLADLLALRQPGPWHFEIAALEGIIAMPSYHATLCALFLYAFRRTGRVGWAMTGLNIVMAVSIAAIGGHYLVDVIAGAGLAVLAILLLRAAEASFTREERRADRLTTDQACQ